MTFHDLGHTAASIAVSAGATVRTVQRMLGLPSAAVTLGVYGDLFDDEPNGISDRLNEAYERSVIGKMRANDAGTKKTLCDVSAHRVTLTRLM